MIKFKEYFLGETYENSYRNAMTYFLSLDSDGLNKIGLKIPNIKNMEYHQIANWLKSNNKYIYSYSTKSDRNLNDFDRKKYQIALNGFVNNVDNLLDASKWKKKYDGGQWCYFMNQVSTESSRSKIYVFYGDNHLNDLNKYLGILIKMLNVNVHCFRQAKMSIDFSRKDDFIFYLSKYGEQYKSQIEDNLKKYGFSVSHGEDLSGNSFGEIESLKILMSLLGKWNGMNDNQMINYIRNKYNSENNLWKNSDNIFPTNALNRLGYNL